jgi:CrcB protein
MTAPSPLLASLYVALGGSVGSVLRFQTGRLVTHLFGPNLAFPWATFAVNVIGSLAMGFLVGTLARHGHGGETWRLLIGVGVLGGFTTFSSFSMETVLLIERGAMGMAVAYVGFSLLAGVGAMFLGLLTMRAVG